MSTMALFVVVVTLLFALGFYRFMKRFWPQDRNASRSAPPSPPQGTQNELDDKNPIWRPPKAS